MRIELSLTPDTRKKTGLKISFNDRVFVMRKKTPTFFTMTREKLQKTKSFAKKKQNFSRKQQFDYYSLNTFFEKMSKH